MAAVVALALTGCAGPSGTAPGPSATTAATTTPPAVTSAPPTPMRSSPAATGALPGTGATPAPAWLGTRVLRTGPDGFGIAGATPPQLVDRRIITTDLLPPPTDGRFHATVVPVPADVARRSTWVPGCPVTLAQLRYVRLSFRGFDGRAHTGELLVNKAVAGDVVKIFSRLFAAGFPIEEMRITRRDELTAPPTGDGNNTGSFVCRPVVGQTTWSQHAFGLAIDLDPFQNPYIRGGTVLPELARAYTDRGDLRPGMILRGGPAVAAFRSAGWIWGGGYTTLKDYMHFSPSGR